LRDRKILGVRRKDGSVLVPPKEYDPDSAEALDQMVEVGQAGVVRSWAWVARPRESQPLKRPFAYALILLDGAATPLLHAVDAGTESKMKTGMRVRARWAEQTVGARSALSPASSRRRRSERARRSPEDPRQARLHLLGRTVCLALPARDRRAAADRAALPVDGSVYFPTRGSCPQHGVLMSPDTVELPTRARSSRSRSTACLRRTSLDQLPYAPIQCCSTAPTPC
jgi:uncharacterized OB-fold protein